MKKSITLAVAITTLLAMAWLLIQQGTHMTIRQRLLKIFYPVLTGIAGRKADALVRVSPGNVTPPISFYDLQFESGSGEKIKMSAFRGKRILVVNTASDCGYTPQYDDLQRLYEQSSGKLVVIGFPANDFKEQEQGNDEEIATFCRTNYGVSFPLAKKSTVIRGPEQHPVFQWLTDPAKNGWNKKQPSWNFSKYLIDEEGRLSQYAEPAFRPDAWAAIHQ